MLLEALVDISVSTTVSEIVDLADLTPTHLVLPSALTSTAITFQVCESKAGTFLPLHKDEGTAISVTVAASRCVSLGAFHDHFVGVRYLKLVCGSAEGADRTIGIIASHVG